MNSVTLYTAVIVLICIKYVFGGACSWKINKDLPTRAAPVYARAVKGYQLVIPDSGYIELKKFNNLSLSCPGRNNAIKDLGFAHESVINIKCEGGHNVIMEGNIRELSTIQCMNNPEADVRSDVIDNTILRIGFDTVRFLELIRVAYDFYNHTPLYAEHTIHGRAFGDYNEKSDSYHDFKAKGVGTNTDWTSIFTKSHVYYQVLVPLLGKTEADKYYNGNNFLAKGHLVAAADFVFQSSRRATYFYANVVPQWQNINNGCWKSLENRIRNVAKDLREDFKVYTGTYDVLKLKNEYNQLVPIHLNGSSVPVPEYIWKVVCSKRDECIGFVVLNNPIIKTNTKNTRIVCNDICHITEWYRASFENNGKVVCCDVNEMKVNFNILNNLNIAGVLLAK